jgi:hypothetical protein
MYRKLSEDGGVLMASALPGPVVRMSGCQRLWRQSETPVVGVGRIVNDAQTLESLCLPGCSMTIRSRYQR